MKLSDALGIPDFQRIVSHFHAGKVSKIEGKLNYYEVTTNQGVFVILEEDSFLWKTEKERLEMTGKKDLERLLLPDYTSKLNPDSSYAHVRGKHYSVYKVLAK